MDQSEEGSQSGTSEVDLQSGTSEVDVQSGTSEVDLQSSGMSRGTMLALVVITVVVLAILLAGGYALLTHPIFTAGLRDISIIVLAFVSVVIGLFLVVLIFQLQSLIALLREEIGPILESANQTAGTVRGTTAFVSDAVVTPMINAASYVSGVRHTIKLLAGGSSNRRKERTSSKTDS
jgi:hypothetical protein